MPETLVANIEMLPSHSVYFSCVDKLHKDGEPIKGTGRARTAASQAYTDDNGHLWAGLPWEFPRWILNARIPRIPLALLSG
jgi:hypothetical protein